MKILILASNPRKDLNLDDEIRDLKDAIERSANRQQFEVEHAPAVRIGDLQDLLFKHRPQIVHFCGHGSGEQGLVFKGKDDGEQWVRAEALSDLFRLFSKDVSCVLLNACYSEEQANAIVDHIDYVIGMNQEIRDDAAIAFSKGFYRALGYDRSVEQAYEFGKNAIQLEISGSSRMRSVASEITRKAEVVGAVQQIAISEHLKPILKMKRNEKKPEVETFETQSAEKAGQERIQHIEKKLIQAEAQLQPELTSQLKDVLKWLDGRKSLSQQATEYLFKQRPELQAWSDDDKEQFSWEMEKYLENIYYSILSETAELLDSPPILPSFDEPELYRNAFEFVKKRLPPRITDQETVNQIRVCFDYLFKVLFPE
jgi:hypothetical protein